MTGEAAPRSQILLALLAVVVAACGASHAGAAASKPVATDAPQCPVTIPGDVFAPRPPHPAAYPHAGLAWYGTDGLWTALETNGVYTPRKSVWWSAGFPGGDQEQQPALSVRWRRIDAAAPVIDNDGMATNAFTPEEGWFMIGGIDPEEPGCWEVEASYKGATLSYVYLRLDE